MYARLEVIKTLQKEIEKIGCEHEVLKSLGCSVFDKMEANIHNPERFWKYVEETSKVMSEKSRTKKFVVEYMVGGDRTESVRSGYESLKDFLIAVDDETGILTTEYGVNLKNIKIETIDGKIVKLKKDERGRFIIEG